MNILPLEAQVRIVSALVEGVSIRATSRLTGADRETVGRYGLVVGEACARLHDARVRGLRSTLIQCDELWSFVGKKQHRVRDDDPAEFGDEYTFLGIDEVSKLIISWRTGKRDGANTRAFALDLRVRVLGRPQVSTDAFKPYENALEEAFGCEIDYGQVVKLYAGDSTRMDAAHRYSPGHVTAIAKAVIAGTPDLARICTSHAERANLSVRLHVRRFTRLTNGFSKSLRHLRAAVALFVAWFNFCRIHETLRVTPAMAADLTDHVWDVAELIREATATPDAPGTPEPTPSEAPPVAPTAIAAGGAAVPNVAQLRHPRLVLIRGGLA